jgi:hypothetical protein
MIHFETFPRPSSACPRPRRHQPRHRAGRARRPDRLQRRRQDHADPLPARRIHPRGRGRHRRPIAAHTTARRCWAGRLRAAAAAAAEDAGGPADRLRRRAVRHRPAAHRRLAQAPRPRRRRRSHPALRQALRRQKQKLLIAIALGREAKVLVMDEPAANLDPEARKIFFELLAERQHDATMLISSHRLNEVATLVNRVVELDMGAWCSTTASPTTSRSPACSTAASASSASSRPSPRRSRLEFRDLRRWPRMDGRGGRPRPPALPRHDCRATSR